MGAGKRGNKDAKHVRIYDAMQASAAWRALSGNAVKLLLHVAGFEKGDNNGVLFMSEREAAAAVGLSPTTVAGCFDQLERLGFLICTERGGFNRKVRHASAWRLTWRSCPSKRIGATNEWREWKPEASEDKGVSENPRRQKLDTTAPEIGAVEEIKPSTAPEIGAVAHANPPIPISVTAPEIGAHTVASGEALPSTAKPTAPDPLLPGGPKPTARQALGLGEAGDTRDCQRCGTGFTLDRADRAYPRLYCSTTCRKGDERDRERNKRRVEAGKEPTDSFAHLKRGAA